MNEVTLRDIGSCLALVCLDTEYVDPKVGDPGERGREGGRGEEENEGEGLVGRGRDE